MARIDDLRKLMAQHRKNLDELKEQQAAFAPPFVPPHMLFRRVQLEEELQRLEEELEILESSRDVADDAAGPPPTVFVSYSHKDELEKEELLTHLRVLERAGLFKLWIDDHIEGGGDWFKEINQALSEASVVILLISNNFLLSDFISNNEVPAALERREKERITVFPIIAKYAGWWAFDWLNKMNVRPKNGLPIWRGGDGQTDKELYEIAREIALLVMKQRQKKKETKK